MHAWYYTAASGQSAKFVAVWNTLQPVPSLNADWSKLAVVSGRTFASVGLLLFWTLCIVLVYATVMDSLAGKSWKKGNAFGVVIWAIVFVFFGSFSHFNVLDMPLQFVLGELVLEAIICLAGGITTAAIYQA